MVVSNRALMHPPSEDFRSRTLLTRADATVQLADLQLARLETVLAEVRNTEQFVEERRQSRGHAPDRRR